MSENDDVIDGPNENTCSECHKRFDVRTGEIVRGWERVYIVSPSPLICGGCKDRLIDALTKDI